MTLIWWNTRFYINISSLCIWDMIFFMILFNFQYLPSTESISRLNDPTIYSIFLEFLLQMMLIIIFKFGWIVTYQYIDIFRIEKKKKCVTILNKLLTQCRLYANFTVFYLLNVHGENITALRFSKLPKRFDTNYNCFTPLCVLYCHSHTENWMQCNSI